jgi:hypothetical protein
MSQAVRKIRKRLRTDILWCGEAGVEEESVLAGMSAEDGGLEGMSIVGAGKAAASCRTPN